MASADILCKKLLNVKNTVVESSIKKIDGAIAAIMAPDRAIRRGNDSNVSAYDSRGLLFVFSCIFC